MVDDDGHDEDYVQEDGLPELPFGENSTKPSTIVELQLAYSSVKLLNLEMLSMQVAGKANDLEAVNMEYEDISYEYIEKFLELDVLSGILDVEVNKLHSFITSLHIEFMDSQQSLSHDVPPEEFVSKIEDGLQNANQSAKRLQDLVAGIRGQAAKFGRPFAFFQKQNCSKEGEQHGNCHSLFVNNKWELQTVDQQRNALWMLDKCTSRELDLMRGLPPSRSNKDELKLNLHCAERLLYCMENSIELNLERTFEAENAAEVLLGISKELASRIQVLQLNLNSSVYREHAMRSKFQKNMLKFSSEAGSKETLKTTSVEPHHILTSKEHDLEACLQDADDKDMTNSDVSNVREKVGVTVGQLIESDVQLLLAKSFVDTSQDEQYLRSKLQQMQNVIEDLNAGFQRNEKRAESAEAKCKELSKVNAELRDEISFLRNNGSGDANILERDVEESDSQLEHAKASVGAIEEDKSILDAEIFDMENIIEDLKGKILKAESRAQNAESKCNLLAEVNLELNEELGVLRSRLDSLETSLDQAEEAKIATAKDIGIRAKIVSDLVMRLALERKELQIQMTALTTKNKILSEKIAAKGNIDMSLACKGIGDAAGFSFQKSSGEALTYSSSTDVKVKSAAVSAEESKIDTVRMVEETQFDWKQVFMAALVLFISVLTISMYQRQSTRV